MTAGAESPSAAPLARVTHAIDAWAGRRRWISRRTPLMLLLDVVLLVVMLLGLFAPPLPQDLFTGSTPVFEVRQLRVDPEQNLVAPLGKPFAVEENQSYRIKLLTDANPGFFLQVMAADGKAIHGWRHTVSFLEGHFDEIFRVKEQAKLGPVQLRVTITPSEVAQTLPFLAIKLQVFPFNRIYFELKSAQRAIGFILLLLLPIYYYLRHLSPLLHGTGGGAYAAVNRGLTGLFNGLHGFDGPLEPWREAEHPAERHREDAKP